MAKNKTTSEVNFKAAALKMLSILGGQVDPELNNSEHHVVLDTVAGPLRCQVHDESISMQFENARKATELIHFGSLDSSSGQWNCKLPDRPNADNVAVLMIRLASISNQKLNFDKNILDVNAKNLGRKPNTKFSYLYRDAKDNTVHAEVVLQGTLQVGEVGVLLGCCDRTQGVIAFIPGMVGLRDLQNKFASGIWDPDHDHLWHEVTSLTATDEKPNCEEHFGHIVNLFAAMAKVAITTGWRDNYKPPFYGEMIEAYAESIRQGERNWRPSSGNTSVALDPLPHGDTVDMEAQVRATPFVMGYVVAALWTEEERLPEGSAIQNISSESLRKAYTECESFVAANLEFLSAAYDIYPSSGDGSDVEEQAGHDLWLTRNHHGAGFWDRKLGKIGEKLTADAHAMGGCDFVADDAGNLYFEGGGSLKAPAATEPSAPSAMPSVRAQSKNELSSPGF